MKPKQSVISLIGFCVIAALGAALAFAVMVPGGAIALASHQTSAAPQMNSPIAQDSAALAPNPAAATFNGMITDSYCGARHRRTSHQTSTECARACVRKGASYVLVDGDRRYRLTGGDDVLDKLAGQRANVTGARQGSTIVVNSAAPIQLP